MAAIETVISHDENTMYQILGLLEIEMEVQEVKVCSHVQSISLLSSDCFYTTKTDHTPRANNYHFLRNLPTQHMSAICPSN